jgi:hypothetical protein
MLDERPNEFDQRNLFLQAVLGLVSVSRHLDEALSTSSDDEPLPLSHPWLLCVLGMVALRERAMTVLAPIISSPRSSRESQTYSHAPLPLQEILR